MERGGHGGTLYSALIESTLLDGLAVLVVLVGDATRLLVIQDISDSMFYGLAQFRLAVT
jgi:hypothetical protein